MTRLGVLFLLVSLIAFHVPAGAADSFQMIHSFTVADGSYPCSALVQAFDGSFYSTAELGGTNAKGTIFKITPDGTRTVVHSFAGPEGAEPHSGLMQASDGNLYGTTWRGGANDHGTLFRITPAGVVTAIHHFSGVLDGSRLSSPLVQGRDGVLYGTAMYGGAFNNGTIFRITLGGTFTRLFEFDAQASTGSRPYSRLFQATDGNFYGTTTYGGANNLGVVYRITPAGSYTVLHNFNETDGARPAGALLQATDGFLYGTTYQTSASNQGTIFRISLSGDFTSLYKFQGADGSMPNAGLMQVGDGYLYGSSTHGGANGFGTLFRWKMSGGGLTTLHHFSDTDGSTPYDRLVRGRDGNLYGTTESGGALGMGTVYRLALPGRLVVQNSSDGRVAFLNLNGAAVASVQFYAPNLPAEWRVAGMADFDRDGITDLVVQNRTSRAAAIIHMKSATSPREAVDVTPTLPENWEVVATGHFDVDNVPELIAQNVLTGRVAVLAVSSGKVTSSRPLSQNLAPNWRVAGAWDFNLDGKTDLVVQDQSTRRISILTLDGTKITSSVSVFPTLPAGWTIGAIGDYDGDSGPELVAQNYSTRQISLLKVENMRIVASVSVNPPPAAGWKLVGPK